MPTSPVALAIASCPVEPDSTSPRRTARNLPPCVRPPVHPQRRAPKTVETAGVVTLPAAPGQRRPTSDPAVYGGLLPEIAPSFPEESRAGVDVRPPDPLAPVLTVAGTELAPAPVGTRRRASRDRAARTVVRRRRRTLAVLVVLGVAAAAAYAAPGRGSAGGHGPGSAATNVVVKPGDSLWSIARGVAPDRDPRDVIYAIEQRNGLHGDALVAGQRLAVPDLRR